MLVRMLVESNDQSPKSGRMEESVLLGCDQFDDFGSPDYRRDWESLVNCLELSGSSLRLAVSLGLSDAEPACWYFRSSKRLIAF